MVAGSNCFMEASSMGFSGLSGNLK